MDEHIKHIADIAEQYWERVTQGEPQEDIVRSLQEDGYAIIESIATIRMLFNVSLREAIELVGTHPAWQKKSETPPALPREVWL